MKKHLLSALPLLALLALPASPAHAAQSAEQSRFLRSLAAAADCATAPAAARVAPASAALPFAPQPQNRTGGGCNAGFCQSNDECPCDTAVGTCSGGVCSYSGGGSPGGGDLGCPAAFCFLDSQCQSNCKAGPNSYCGPGGLCVYVP
jgi:hypothetical protein